MGVLYSFKVFDIRKVLISTALIGPGPPNKYRREYARSNCWHLAVSRLDSTLLPKMCECVAVK